MKVRINNDILLNVHLSRKYIKDPVNIKNVQCILTTGDHCTDTPFTPSHYDINRCGLPVYHMMPCCDGDSYSMCCYNGFGVDINKNRTYYKDCHTSCCCACCNDNEYRAEVRSTSAQDSFIVYFPANQQKVLGKYKLIVQAQIFEPGYDTSNLRTVTIDYPDVFELVANSSEADASDCVSIEVGNGQDTNINCICINPGSVTECILGNVGFITVQACPATSSNQNFIWGFDDAHMDKINDKGNTFMFRATNIPTITSGVYTTQVKVTSLDNMAVSKTIDVVLHNHAEDLQIASSTSTNNVAYGTSLTLTPVLTMQNGDKLVTYTENGEFKSVVTTTVETGSEYANVYMLDDGSIRIQNTNSTESAQVVSIKFISNIDTIDGETPTVTYNLTLSPNDGSNPVIPSGEDKHISSQSYDPTSHILTATLNTGETFKANLATEFEFNNR